MDANHKRLAESMLRSALAIRTSAQRRDFLANLLNGQIEREGAQLSPVARSVVHAVVQAKEIPGSLARVMCKSIDDATEAYLLAENIAKHEGVMDEAKSRAAFERNDLVIELTNGSAVEVVLPDE